MTSSRRVLLSLKAALCLAFVVLVTALNYYGFATTRVQASSSVPSQMAALEIQTQNHKLFQEIRDLLSDTANTSQAIATHATEQPATPIPDKEMPKFPADHDGSNMHIVFSASCDQRNRLLQQTVVQLTASGSGKRSYHADSVGLFRKRQASCDGGTEAILRLLTPLHAEFRSQPGARSAGLLPSVQQAVRVAPFPPAYVSRGEARAGRAH